VCVCVCVWSLNTQICLTHPYYTLWGRGKTDSKYICSNLHELPGRVCTNNTKMDLKETGCKDWFGNHMDHNAEQVYQRRLQMRFFPVASVTQLSSSLYIMYQIQLLDFLHVIRSVRMSAHTIFYVNCCWARSHDH